MTRTLTRRDTLKAAGIAATGTIGLAGCLGEEGEYPSDDLTVIIPFDEGGGSDTIVRQMADPLSEELGVNIRPENVPGAGSMRGIGQLLTEEPDGYTCAKFNPLTTSIQAMVNPPDFEMADLKGLATIGFNAIVLVADADEEVDGLDGLIDGYTDGEYDNLGGLGVNYLPNAMFFKERFGMEWSNYIEYSGAGPINQAVASGEVPAAVTSDAGAAQAVESGDVDVLAVLTSNGSEVFPDAPTVPDLGYENMDFIGQVTRAMWVPPETPDDRVETLAEGIEAVIEGDVMQSWSDDTGNPMTYGSPSEADDVLDRVWTEIPDVVDIDELREASE
ncbi:ABC transporter substrate-binding protein [Halorubrum sp. JWXQ-INN 858]|uniref:Bug family tripartite tricarboxylate transporter substrate binding protein n=1 Tax=Halorubrum sp. JWXQ-INN 858 TaxID=2690782 RepID=UPI001358D66D|nr:tripartite tricarboxylate transporter substrate-binding protein [Halorubrum sp. JWXQ-INN 858]MWV65097.1 ABC transporter substrate-binding protein [Halorubrum sp. JWXQ-INN 858]